MAESQPGPNQIMSALGLSDGGMEIFSDPLLAANLWDDLQIRDKSEDHSVARQGQIYVSQSLLTLVTQSKSPDHHPERHSSLVPSC